MINLDFAKGKTRLNICKTKVKREIATSYSACNTADIRVNYGRRLLAISIKIIIARFVDQLSNH